MRKTLNALLLLTAFLAAAPAYADPPGRVGRLNYVSGAVSFAAVDARDWSEAVMNRPLTGGDRLWADRDARAELHVGSTAVRLAPLTALDIVRLDDSHVELRLEQGIVALRVRELDADDYIEVFTSAGSVAVRQPGSYRITADPQSGTTRVAVNFGELEVATSARRFLVPADQIAVISPTGQAAFELAHASMDEFDRWSAERDRRADSVASTRYVSSQMTGYQDLDHHGSWRTVPEYGPVWTPARVSPGWAPYRHGRWFWVSPWGWTWVDDAPWGFAPFHYGRWVWLGNHWAWTPGRFVRRPIYAPALVAFIGGPHWSVSMASGPPVGWFPLGWREPFHPWYRASHRHVANVNVTHVTNVTNVDVRHVHRHRPDAVTVVSRDSFVSGRHVARSRMQLAQTDLARAEILRDRAPAEPVRVAPPAPPVSVAQPQRGDEGHRGFGPGARRERELANRSEPLPGRVDALPMRTERAGRGPEAIGVPRMPQQAAAPQPPRAAAAPIAPPAAPIAPTAPPISPPAQAQGGDEGHRGQGPGARRQRELAAKQPPPPAPPAAQPQRGDDGHRGQGPGARRERELSGGGRSDR